MLNRYLIVTIIGICSHYSLFMYQYVTKCDTIYTIRQARRVSANRWELSAVTYFRLNAPARSRLFTVAAYSAAHFIVDFACAFFIFSALSSAPDWRLHLLMYNFCAFAMQMPLGVLADRVNRNALIASLGCLLIAAAYFAPGLPLMAVLAAGLGNGMFHIGAGIDVMNVSDGKAGALGVFVSPGAFGVYFGTILGKGGYVLAVPVLLALAASAGLIFVLSRNKGAEHRGNAPFSLEGAANPSTLIAACCFFLVVCLRSYAGLSFSFPWKSAGNWGVILVCAVVLGKTAGGFASDRFGAVRTTCVSLGAAAALFLFARTPAAGVAAMFLFNMTMPVTLWGMAARLFPGAKGFAFGLLTFALFAGYLPVYLGAAPPYGEAWPFALAGALSLALLWAGFAAAKHGKAKP